MSGPAEAGGDDPHPHSLMTSREVDEVVWSYLVESGYAHTAFSLLHESSLGSPNYPSQSNGRKHDSLFGQTVPPGHLVRILQKGLLYLEAEARYRGDPPDPPPRLVGYTIPNALPLPPLPKPQPSLPTQSEPPTPGPSTQLTTNGKEPTPAPSTSTLASPKEAEPVPAAEPTPTPAVSAPSPAASLSTTSAKEKGKGKEREMSTGGKRKGRGGSDREDPANGTEGKRARLANSEKEEKEKKKKGVNGRLTNGTTSTTDEALHESTLVNGTPMPTKEASPAPLPAGSSKASKTSRSASPAQQRAVSPSASRKGASTNSGPVTVPLTSSTPTPSSTASAIAALPSFSRNKSSSNTTSSLSTSSLPPKLPPSAPTSPSFAEVPLPPEERRASLPETPATLSTTEIVEIKREELEAAAAAALSLGLVKEVGVVDSDKMAVDPPAGTTDPGESTVEEGEMEDVFKVGADNGLVIRLRGHTMPKVQPCSWNPKVPSLLATGGGDSTCRIWDVPAPGRHGDGTIMKDHIVCKHSSAQRRADVAAVAWDPTGSLLATGSEDGIARIWTPSGDLHLVLSMHQRTIFSLKWNSVGTMLLTGSLDSSVCLWELSNGKVKQQWQTHLDSVLDVDWNDDQTFASASMDKSIHLFSISRITPVHRFKGHRDEVNVVKFSSCGTLVASCSDDRTVRIWSLRNIPGLPLSPKLIVGEEDRLIDEEDNGGSFTLEGHTSDVHKIAWAPWTKGSKEPRLLASASFDKTAKLWNAEDGTCLHTFARHTDMVYSLAFSPSLGTYLATGSNDGKMHIWTVKDRDLVMEYEHPGPIYELAWHLSGKQVAVCGRTEDVAAVSLRDA